MQVIPKYRQTASLLNLIDGIEVEEINSKSLAVGALLSWCKQVLEVRERAKVKLHKEEEIEEAEEEMEEEEEEEAEPVKLGKRKREEDADAGDQDNDTPCAIM